MSYTVTDLRSILFDAIAGVKAEASISTRPR